METINCLLFHLRSNIFFKYRFECCDQGSTNRAAIRQFSSVSNQRGYGKYFLVNDNAFFKYNIHFEKYKLAMSEHEKICCAVDKERRFRNLRQIRDVLTNILKVSIPLVIRKYFDELKET